MEIVQETSHMDRLTQTQNCIDDLIRIMASSLHYLSRNASFKQLDPNFPVTQSIPNADSPEQYDQNRKELVSDFLHKAKQLEYLIAQLPSSPAPASSARDDADTADFAQLETELQSVNDEYLAALDQAEDLQRRLQASLNGVLESKRQQPATTSSSSSSSPSS